MDHTTREKGRKRKGDYRETKRGGGALTASHSGFELLMLKEPLAIVSEGSKVASCGFVTVSHGATKP